MAPDTGRFPVASKGTKGLSLSCTKPSAAKTRPPSDSDGVKW